jgi:hypothetical protein
VAGITTVFGISSILVLFIRRCGEDIRLNWGAGALGWGPVGGIQVGASIGGLFVVLIV